jgi:hypothetical protein
MDYFNQPQFYPNEADRFEKNKELDAQDYNDMQFENTEMELQNDY